jgi:hypothetical protein
MKLLLKYGDKLICGLVLLFAAYRLVLFLANMGEEPASVQQVRSTISKAKAVKNDSMVDALDLQFEKSIATASRWEQKAGKKRASVHFQHETVDVGILQRAYEEDLKNCPCHFEAVSEDVSLKRCIFPGCKEIKEAPKVYLGLPIDLKVEEVSLMTVQLSWKGVVDLREAKHEFCMLQRRSSEGEEWITIKDDRGQDLRISPRVDGHVEQDSSKVERLSSFMIPKADVVEDAESPVPVVAVSEQFYNYTDFNLDPDQEYRYRVKAFGSSLRDQTSVEGLSWTEEIVTRTEKDKGFRFIKYIPGLKDASGEPKALGGGRVSQDKVYVSVTKLFTPPWSPLRYFISYDHRGIVPGVEDQDVLGKLERRYSIKTVDGTQVYIDKRKENFLYVSEEMSKEDLKRQLDDEKGDWRPYRIEMDFSTPWKALAPIEEETVEDKSVTVKYNAKGEKESRSDTVEKYRYFLNVLNTETQATMRLELERDNMTTRLLKY